MSDDRSIADLPEETQSYIRNLRAEAAQYRTQRNDAQTELANVTTKYTEAGGLLKTANEKLDEYSAYKDTAEKLSADLAQRDENLGRVNTWAEALGIDLDDAKRLQGTTPEEWKADAEKLAPKFTSKSPRVPKNPGAGDPPSGESTEDPISKAFREIGL